MKNGSLLPAILLLATTFMVSCKKDYTCKCSKTYTTGSGSSTYNYSMYTYNDIRPRAEERCNANTSSGTDLGGDYSVNCKIY
jgi:hypothetical protein